MPLFFWACPLRYGRGRAFRSYSSLVPRCGVTAAIPHAGEKFRNPWRVKNGPYGVTGSAIAK